MVQIQFYALATALISIIAWLRDKIPSKVGNRRKKLAQCLALHFRQINYVN
jgi:hypothetical protein